MGVLHFHMANFTASCKDFNPSHEIWLMEREKQRIAAVLCSLAGMVCLVVLAGIVGPTEVTARDITSASLGSSVKLCASVCEASLNNGTTFGLMCDGSYGVKFVYWGRVNVTAGMKACVTGRVMLYEDDVELVIQDVKPHDT